MSDRPAVCLAGAWWSSHYHNGPCRLSELPCFAVASLMGSMALSRHTVGLKLLSHPTIIPFTIKFAHATARFHLHCPVKTAPSDPHAHVPVPTPHHLSYLYTCLFLYSIFLSLSHRLLTLSFSLITFPDHSYLGWHHLAPSQISWLVHFWDERTYGS